MSKSKMSDERVPREERVMQPSDNEALSKGEKA